MTRTSQRLRRLESLSVVILFLSLISLPAARNVLGPPAPSMSTENRVPHAMPPLALKGGVLRSFPACFDDFYNDHFGFRSLLAGWLQVAQVRWLKISSTPKVILGKKGWLYFTDMPPGNDEAMRPFTSEQLARWQHLLEARRDWLAARGIRYLFVIAPDKQSIYPEYLPQACQRRQGGGPRRDQLLAHLRAHSDLVVLDLAEPLRQAKSHERVYHQTDSHWNARGAHVAYRQIVTALAAWFPGMEPVPRGAFDEVSRQCIGGDCAMLLNLHERITEESLELVARTPPRARPTDPNVPWPLPPWWPRADLEQPDRRLPRAVIFRDSFAGPLIPFLSEHFQRIVYVWQGYPVFDRRLIEQERPDVVIQEMVERKLTYPDLKGFGPLSAPDGDQLCQTPEAWIQLLRNAH